MLLDIVNLPVTGYDTKFKYLSNIGLFYYLYAYNFSKITM